MFWYLKKTTNTTNIMNNIKDLKKELRLSNKDLAGFFGMTVECFQNSSAKKRYEQAIINFYNFVK